MEPTATLSPDETSVQRRVKVESSVASPTFVDVPCASTNSTDEADSLLGCMLEQSLGFGLVDLVQ